MPIQRRNFHPRDDINTILRLLYECTWTVCGPQKGRLSLSCACGNHSRTVARSKTGDHYSHRLLLWLRSLPCWKEDECGQIVEKALAA
jgi:hypothetical protein